MKILIALLLALPSFAADPVVVVNSAMSVTIDGKDAGSVVDALANNPNVANLRARLLDAWLARESEITAVEKARADTAIATAQDKAAADVAKAKDDADVAVAAAAAKATAADKETARCAAIVAALKSVNMGPLPAVVAQAIVDEDAKKKAALEAQKAAIEADIAKLTP